MIKRYINTVIIIFIIIIICGELLNVSQPTASRTIAAVTTALRRQLPNWVQFPNQEEADKQKRKFREIARFPNVIGCVDSTHVEIQAPSINEHEYVNRKNTHSINVMVSSLVSNTTALGPIVSLPTVVYKSSRSLHYRS